MRDYFIGQVGHVLRLSLTHVGLIAGDWYCRHCSQVLNGLLTGRLPLSDKLVVGSLLSSTVRLLRSPDRPGEHLVRPGERTSILTGLIPVWEDRRRFPFFLRPGECLLLIRVEAVSSADPLLLELHDVL